MRNIQKIDISSATILRFVLIMLALVFLYLVREVVVMLIAAVLIASAIEPMANTLQKRYKVPRGISVISVYLAFLLSIVGAFYLMIPPLMEQVQQLVHAFPQIVANLGETVGVDVVTEDPAVMTAQLQDIAGRFMDNIANIRLDVFERTRAIIVGIVSVLFVFIIALYLVIEENALKKAFRLIVPQQHIPYVDLMIDRVQRKLGKWLLAQLVLGVLVGTVVGVGLWLMGVKYALALGILAGVLEIIPVIGPIIAGMFGVTVALSQSFVLGIVVLVFYIAVQQIENHLFIPHIMKRATGLNPIFTLTAILLGARLAGLVGIILSVPVAIIVSLILSDILSTRPVEE